MDDAEAFRKLADTVPLTDAARAGLAAFLDHFPSAEVICHAKAFRFLTDPSRLWEGSRSVLGEIAEAYGVWGEEMTKNTDPLSDDQLTRTI